MRKKNEIEHKMDEKEPEIGLNKDLNSENSRIEKLEKFYEDDTLM